MGCDQLSDLNFLFSSFDELKSIKERSDTLGSVKPVDFGSTAIRNSSLATAKQSLMIPMHGSMVFVELVGNRSRLMGLFDICN